MSRGPSADWVGIEEGEDRRSIVTPTLRLTFRRDGDRWSHALEDASAGSASCLALSIEGDPGDRGECASPVYQYLAFQRRGHGVDALLVGQADERHDSATFTVLEQANGAVVEVDVASRGRSSHASPCCAYRIAATPGDIEEAATDRIAWILRAPLAGRLVFESATLPTPPSRLTLSEAGRLATHAQAGAVEVSGTATRRLGFRWQWAPAPDRRAT